ncbi:cupin domain-containing protein [Candidatus Nitrosocosmicus hydrocola]|uniref:cupin domain-containing protein n=1 Tax=Candidatus Nitrosocosmicus hydrocola TaxID=1826872 RepID=UPI000A904DD8|nr:cupin domain-containing protein [Candidatus Nitrosocosmicus hydrocola]
MGSIHTFNLKTIKPQAVCNGGTRTMVYKNNFSILKDMAFYLLELDQEGVREPHWHPNAAELSYCLSGSALVTIFSPGARHDTFTVKEGDIVYVPRGYLHHIENINQGETKFAIAFNHEMPEDIGLSGSTGSISNNILGVTFGVESEYFENFKKSNHDLIITSKSNLKNTTFTNQQIPNYHKFNLKAFPPEVQTKGGMISLGNADSFEILKGLACYLLTLKPKGIREPHWHPNAAELDYVIKGRARMTIFSPGDNVDTFEVGVNDIVFIPPGYFHYIENLNSNEDMQFAVFFNDERPEDIGISGAFGVYSNEVLASLFKVESKVLDSLPKYQEDRFVVAAGGGGGGG